MTDADRTNLAYFESAMKWVAMRLRAQLDQEPAPTVPSESPPAEPARRSWGRRGTPALPSPDPGPTPQQVAQQQATEAEQAMNAAAVAEPTPKFIALCDALDVWPYERKVLLLCIAQESLGLVPMVCARLNGDPAARHPTFALAARVFGEEQWEAMLPDRPLRHFRLIEIIQAGTEPLATSALRVDEHVLAFVRGQDDAKPEQTARLDAMLRPYLTRVSPLSADAPLSASQQTSADGLVAAWTSAGAKAPWPVAQMVGGDLDAKYAVAAGVASGVKRTLYRLPAELLPTNTADVETFARLWERDSLLHGLALFVDAQEIDAAAPAAGEASVSSPVAPSLVRLLSGLGDQAAVFLAVREPWPRPGRAAVTVEVARATHKEQREHWQTWLGEKFGPLLRPAAGGAADQPALWSTMAGLLSGQFDLGLPVIRRAIEETALSFEAVPAAGPPEAVRWLNDALWKACRRHAEPRLQGLAQRIDTEATWRDLVLPRAQRHTLYAIARQVRYRGVVYDEWGFAERLSRGQGIAALFAGESGTGKTLAAEVLANTLDLGLFRIDLSAVVSKYIGETEKNLRRLFDTAEDGGVILFFDEADALFGKRSEVKDSHDRYANIEVNYLLQRMEAYRGLAILATNRRSALDPAFTRRLRFIVNFPAPAEADRRRMWRRAFPVRMPLGEVDFARLARLPLVGGAIRNVAINAAFAAARHPDRPLTTDAVLRAARDEYVKQGRSFNEQDFRPAGVATRTTPRAKSLPGPRALAVGRETGLLTALSPADGAGKGPA